MGTTSDPNSPRPSFTAPEGNTGWSARRKVTIGVIAAFVGLMTLGAIVGDPPEDAPPSAAQASEEKPELALSITSASAKEHGDKTVTAIRGTATPGATIVVGSKSVVADPAGNWALRAGYDPDRESFTVRASLRGETTQELVEQPTLPSLKVSVSGSNPYDIYADQGTLRGRVTAQDGSDNTRGTVRNVRVTVNGHPASVDGSDWSAPVTVTSGTKTFKVAASKPGYDGDSTTAEVRRRLSKAEKEARAAAAKQQWMASATTIPFKQLDKNPDRYSGERVVYRGEIFQIQEDFGSTVILLSVTDAGYGFWTDEIMVTYDGTTEAVKDDIITVYGTVVGSETYDTRIGGENTVAKIEAKYIVR